MEKKKGGHDTSSHLIENMNNSVIHVNSALNLISIQQL